MRSFGMAMNGFFSFLRPSMNRRARMKDRARASRLRLALLFPRERIKNCSRHVFSKRGLERCS